MTISTATVLKAVLSMDAYNRGYNQGLILGGTKIGSATIVNDSGSLKENDVRIDQPNGFYAIAYQMADGSNVISYRGTDAFVTWPWDDKSGSDIWNGWGVGRGSPQGKQAALAFQFYQTIAGTGVDPRTANIALTGHSLGGGLAANMNVPTMATYGCAA